MVALDAAHHRVLARDVAALRTQPPQAMSAMDGYAVRSADASAVAARLKVIGEVAAGRPFEKTVGAGEAVRIFTGGVIPEGADAVIIQEDTVVEDGGITITEAASPGRHIRPAGVDFRQGDVLLARGTRLTDRDLSLAAGMNYPELAVRRRPKVAMLATGDELVMPGSTPGPGQIVYSNGYALRALARQEGAETIDLGIAADTVEATTLGIRRARDSGADILITTGGASVGDHDLVKQSLEAEGVTMAFWRIAMRPGKPMMHGRLGAMRVIGLPGNPVSSYVCGFLFLVPLIRAACRAAPSSTTPTRRRCSGAMSPPTTCAKTICAPASRCARRRPDRHAGRPSGQFAVGKSRCGTGACDPCAVCAGGRRRIGLRYPAAAGLSPLERLVPAKPGFVDEKLSGCGTHMEHIVSVHDLFLSNGVYKWESRSSEFLSGSDSRNRTALSTWGTGRDAHAQTI